MPRASRESAQPPLLYVYHRAAEGQAPHFEPGFQIIPHVPSGTTLGRAKQCDVKLSAVRGFEGKSQVPLGWVKVGYNALIEEHVLRHIPESQGQPVTHTVLVHPDGSREVMFGRSSMERPFERGSIAFTGGQHDLFTGARKEGDRALTDGVAFLISPTQKQAAKLGKVGMTRTYVRRQLEGILQKRGLLPKPPSRFARVKSFFVRKK